MPDCLWRLAGGRCRWALFLILLYSLGPATAQGLPDLENVKDPTIDRYVARIVQKIPHDPLIFSQGIAFGAASLWESAGRYGQSRLLRYRIERPIRSLEVSWSLSLPTDQFAEGITILDDVLYQLTWKAGVVHRYRLGVDAIETLRDFRIDRQGWGLATDGEFLITSDGSENLVFRSARDFSAVRIMPVTFQGQALRHLNELEVVDGSIWANIWKSPFLVVIEPTDGKVTGVIDCAALVDDAAASGLKIDVLNGIAQDPVTKEIYLTGKLWPWIYSVKLERHE